MHFHYHNKNIIQVSLNVSPTNAQQVKVTSNGVTIPNPKVTMVNGAQNQQVSNNSTTLGGGIINSVFLGDNLRKKSFLGEKQPTAPITSSFNRKTSLSSKQS